MGKEQSLLDRAYTAKILLFGEHIVLNGAMSLAIPISQFKLWWKKGGQTDSLNSFYEYLSRLDFVNQDMLRDLKTLQPRFESDIPQGYGVGSSGALCAAVYEYIFPNFKEKKVNTILKELANFEHFFHGKSSGLDALVILFKHPVIVENRKVRFVNFINDSFMKDLYLVDSGQSRSSKDIINYFSKLDLKNREKIKELVFVNNTIVKNLMNQNVIDFYDLMRRVSELQFETLGEMILPQIKGPWEEGLNSGEYFIKLCGAGGGGYYLAWGNHTVINGLNLSVQHATDHII